MSKIISRCKESGIVFCDHATSLLWIVASNIQNSHLTQAIESMHPSMVFSRVEDVLGNLISQLKDWHETMLKSVNSHNRTQK
jgi:hypothetical protein